MMVAKMSSKGEEANQNKPNDYVVPVNFSTGHSSTAENTLQCAEGFPLVLIININNSSNNWRFYNKQVLDVAKIC